jgi:iron(III) transport system substrate-binding protein
MVRTLWQLCALSVILGGTAQAGTVTAYSALEEDEIAEYVAAAKRALPDVDLKVLRLSTGDLGARILAESANPQHDVIWGFAVTNLLDPRLQALVEPYRAKGTEALGAQYRAGDDKWFAATGYMAAFCVNTERLKTKGLPAPKDWTDLLDPKFKGEVVLPNPVSSGTGYLQIVGILQQLGEEPGWKFLKELDGNVAQYIKSGSRPCKAARAGEFAVGASLAFAAIQSIEEGFPITMAIPAKGAGYELEGNALMAAARNKPDAKRFLDWTLSPEAVAIYGKFKEIVTVAGFTPSAAAQKAGLPADVSKALLPIDFAKSARERETILARWQKEIGR